MNGTLKTALLPLLAAGVLAAGAHAAFAEPDTITVGQKINYRQEWDENLGKSLCEFKYPELLLSEEDESWYPALAAALDQRNKEEVSALDTTFNEYLNDAKEMAVENPDYFMTFSDDRYYWVQRSDEAALSFVETLSAYTGGVHGWSGYKSFNYDPLSGKTLMFSDVVNDEEEFRALMKEALNDKYPDMDWYMGQDKLDNGSFENGDFVWTVGNAGVTVWFSNYDIASYAAGLQDVLIPYEEHDGLFNPKYTDAQDNYAYGYPKWVTASIDADGDGVMDEVSYYGEYSGEYAYSGLSVVVNGVTTTIDTWCYEFEGSFVVSDGRTYLYLWSTTDNDYALLDVFDLSSGTAVHVSNNGCGRHFVRGADEEVWMTYQFTDPSDFILDVRTDMLSTISASRHYRTGADGSPEPVGEFFEFGWPLTITVKQDFETSFVDENGADLGTDIIPAGTELTLIRTDNESWTDVRLSDGRIARIYVIQDTWPRTVDGKAIDDLFDGLLFAG